MAEQKFRGGQFVSLTKIFDDRLIQETDPKSREFKDFLIRLRNSINDIAISLNKKDTGYYVEQEFVNGQIFFPNPALLTSTTQNALYRQVYRKVINFGTLPNTATKSVAHGISELTTASNNYTFTRIYGCATDPDTTYIPLPYASATAANIVELSVDNTNVNITTGIDRTGFTTCYVILEYINQ